MKKDEENIHFNGESLFNILIMIYILGTFLPIDKYVLEVVLTTIWIIGVIYTLIIDICRGKNLL